MVKLLKNKDKEKLLKASWGQGKILLQGNINKNYH